MFEGRAIVGAPGPLTDDEVESTQAVLVEIEELTRLDMPATPPPFEPGAAMWAATLLYRICQFAVYRDVGSDVVESELAAPAPSTDDPSAHYSVDLTFRFLPQVSLFLKRAAEKDVLVTEVLRLARMWPLSSVGMPDLGSLNVDVVVSHPSLLFLYVDRIINCTDLSPLDDERVQTAVASALGMHTCLAPKFMSKIAELAPPPFHLSNS
ncbi:MAG: hypothetical protein KDA71_11555 [Planctomycetales bacterium]|nr:hypothetical protein [Planctomycetales bacterium]